MICCNRGTGNCVSSVQGVGLRVFFSASDGDVWISSWVVVRTGKLFRQRRNLSFPEGSLHQTEVSVSTISHMQS